MKTRIFKTNQKLMYFALATLAMVAFMVFLANPVAGVAMAIVGVAGAVDLTPEEEAFKNAILDHVQKAIEKNEKGYITDSTLNATLTAEFKKYAAQFPDPEQVNGLKEAIEGLGLELKSMKETGTDKVIFKSFVQQAKEALNAKSKEDMMKDNQVKFDIDLDLANFKGVGTVARPTGTSWIPPATYDMQWGTAPLNTPTIGAISDRTTMSTSRIVWIESGAREGAAGETGEGLIKNQIDNTPVMKAMDAKKLTGYFNFTEEMLDDMPGFLSEMEKEIMGQITTKEDYQFILGTGLTIYLAGFTTYAKAYDLTTISTPSPNTFDAIVAAMAQVKSHNFTPNAVVMNPIDMAGMRLAKAATTGNYMLLSPNGEIVPGIAIVESNNIPVGSIAVGDFSKYHIRDYKSLTVRFGYTGDNFTYNIQTAIGEKRVAAYMKAGEEYAICYDTIADIKAAITPAS